MGHKALIVAGAPRTSGHASGAQRGTARWLSPRDGAAAGVAAVIVSFAGLRQRHPRGRATRAAEISAYYGDAGSARRCGARLVFEVHEVREDARGVRRNPLMTASKPRRALRLWHRDDSLAALAGLPRRASLSPRARRTRTRRRRRRERSSPTALSSLRAAGAFMWATRAASAWPTRSTHLGRGSLCRTGRSRCCCGAMGRSHMRSRRRSRGHRERALDGIPGRPCKRSRPRRELLGRHQLRTRR